MSKGTSLQLLGVKYCLLISVLIKYSVTVKTKNQLQRQPI